MPHAKRWNAVTPRLGYGAAHLGNLYVPIADAVADDILEVATAGAQTSMAIFALLGALLGHTRMGLLEAELLVVVLPFAVWYCLCFIVRRWNEPEDGYMVAIDRHHTTSDAI